MNAREEMLHRLRSARASSQIPASAEAVAVEDVTASVDECVSRFSIEAAALGIELYVAASANEVRSRLSTLLRDCLVLTWDLEYLPYEAGSVLIRPAFGNSAREQQAAAQIGLTGCDAAIAETASLVLFSGAGKSRAVSLLPPVHVAIVERQKLCFSMAELFANHRDCLTSSTSCTIITGPSRTADIELTLTLGIHGPGRVAVIIGP